MKLHSVFLPVFLCLAGIIALPAAGKHGVQATVHTEIPANAVEGTQVDVSWTLADEKSGKPFSAYRVFIRLFGPEGDSTEAFANYRARPIGTYKTTATIPRGGVVSIEIGVAGTMTDRAGNSERSDWLMALAHNPIKK
jgi:hypothetical protein